MTPLPAAPAGRPVWGRVLIGCAIVGGVFLVTGAVALVLGMYWLTSAGRHYPTAAVAGPHSQGVVHVGDLAGDRGSTALLTSLFRRLQDVQQRRSGQPQLPAWIRAMQAQQARQAIGQWLPREATVSLEPDDTGERRLVFAANLRGFVRPIRMAVTQSMKGDPHATITRHGDREILNVSRTAALCFMDGTLIVTLQPATLPQAIDRLAAAGASPPPAEGRSLPGTWDVSGWMSGPAGVAVLESLLQPSHAEGDPAGETFRELRFGIDIASQDEARVVAEVAFVDKDAAAAARPWLAEGVARLRERMESSGLFAQASDALAGERVRYELNLSGVDSALGRALEDLSRHERTEPAPGR